MKVSNGNNIQKIYQEQVTRVRKGDSGDAFKKVMQSTSQPDGAQKAAFHPPSGVNLTNPVLSGKPVQQADPVETLKFAAEVVASQPDTREDRISQLKKLIESGQYNVSSEAVAERLLRSKHITASWEG
jgi:flagellar biosynthesis anti-sigma factor FlgM